MRGKNTKTCTCKTSYHVSDDQMASDNNSVFEF